MNSALKEDSLHSCRAQREDERSSRWAEYCLVQELLSTSFLTWWLLVGVGTLDRRVLLNLLLHHTENNASEVLLDCESCRPSLPDECCKSMNDRDSKRFASTCTARRFWSARCLQHGGSKISPCSAKWEWESESACCIFFWWLFFKDLSAFLYCLLRKLWS